jgi:hypothetical protein
LQWNDLPDKDRAGGLPGEAPMKGIVEVNTKPDIAPTSLTWNTAQGGVDFSYQVTGADLPKDTTAALYWASGTTNVDIIQSATVNTQAVNDKLVIPAPQGTAGTIHLDASELTQPPPNATHLLLVVDPNSVIAESDETNNVVALAYLPTISVSAKYDGDPSDSVMGRYFAATDALKDNFYTLMLSDSLDALRPQVEVMVGGQTLSATISTTDPHKYVTGSFDPGSLTQEFTPLQGEALIGSTDLADVSASIQVEPLPQWVRGLDKPQPITFDANGDGPTRQGAYVIDGFLPDLSLSGTVFTVPKQVPIIGGQQIQARVDFEVKALAPLAITSTPTLEAGLDAKLNLGDSILIDVPLISPTVSLDNNNVTFTVTPGSTFDPVTLNQPTGFSLTVAFDGKVPQQLNIPLFDEMTVVFPFGISVELALSVSATLSATVHAHAQVGIDSAHGLEFLPAGTYVGLGLEGSIDAKAEAGWFPPAGLQNAFNHRFGHSFNVVTLSLRDTASVMLSAVLEAHFGGFAGGVLETGLLFKGTSTFSNRLDLIFEVGDVTIFDWLISEQTKQLFSWHKS